MTARIGTSTKLAYVAACSSAGNSTGTAWWGHAVTRPPVAIRTRIRQPSSPPSSPLFSSTVFTTVERFAQPEGGMPVPGLGPRPQFLQPPLLGQQPRQPVGGVRAAGVGQLT